MINSDTNQPLRILAQTIQTIRAFLDERGFQEVISPVLHSALPLEPTIYPFTTTWHTNQGDQQLYLATSPENYLKKLLAKGLGNCYSIGHCFRNLESFGTRHHPEFLILEWYREDATHEQIMIDLEQLIVQVISKVDARKIARQGAKNAKQQSPIASAVHNLDIPNCTLSYKDTELHLQPPFPHISFESEFKDKIGVSISDILTDEAIRQLASKRGYNVEHATWEQLFNQIFMNEIEPHFSKQPFFLVDFPTRISPLCKPVANRPYLAQRFEFFIAGLELANGNSENTDAAAVQKSFEAENQRRTSNKQLNSAIDSDFIDALAKMSGKNYAGVGVGVERLAMILAGIDDIHQLSPVNTIVS